MKTPLAAFIPVLALGLSGCVDNHASIEMFGLCAPPEDAEICAMPGTCDAFIASPRPFVFLRNSAGSLNGLELFTEVHNQMPRNDDASAGRVNTNNAIITGYELDFSTLNYTREGYFYAANFPVAAGGTFTPVIKFIPEEIGLEMSQRIAAAAGTDAGPFATIVGVRLKEAPPRRRGVRDGDVHRRGGTCSTPRSPASPARPASSSWAPARTTPRPRASPCIEDPAALP